MTGRRQSLRHARTCARFARAIYRTRGLRAAVPHLRVARYHLLVALTPGPRRWGHRLGYRRYPTLDELSPSRGAGPTPG